MLNPQTNRVDYGDKLRPPAGFELSYALATTFSLELDTLLCLPIALCFDSTLEGDLQGEKMAMLEAIGQLSGRLKVFFQQGNIHAPHSFNRLFTLLEPCLAPVVPDTEFSSFHPKIWLLRFTDPGKQVRYRLLVLSRNLTFDRSWDIAVTLEGRVGENKSSENDGLLDLLANLAPQATEFASAFSAFKKELPKVQWEIPAGFSSLKTLLGSPDHVPLDFGRGTNAVLVISPFLHADALDLMKSKASQCWLFSCADELNRISVGRLDGWQCYSLSERIVDGEDELENAKAQNLHAKVILVQNGATNHWHIGSANATTAALGDGSAQPRNTEFMVRMSGTGEAHSPEYLITELVGTEEEPTGIFVRHVFEEPAVNDEPLESHIRRQLVHLLIQAEWCIHARPADEEAYVCEVTYRADLINRLPAYPGVIEVGQLAMGTFKPLSSPLVWEGMAATQVSAFLPLRVVIDGIVVLEVIVKAKLSMQGGDRRDQKIYADLIDGPEKFMAYVHMLLQPNRDKTELFDIDLSRSGSSWADGAMARLINGPIFESLLRSAARRPEQLQRIDVLLGRLSAAKVAIPEQFSQLWKQYKSFLVKKK